MYHVIPSLHRIHYKATVILASSVAFDFRRRWDCPGFRDKFEKPFHWSDEAEVSFTYQDMHLPYTRNTKAEPSLQPLLAHHSRDPSSFVIDSAHPCTVPHIVITEAPPQDPWEAIVNCTPNPQDCGFGYYLTVPSSLVDTINTELPGFHTCDDPYFTSPESAYDSSSELGVISESESGSDDDSPILLTPPNSSSKLLDIDVVISDSCLHTTTTDFQIYDDEDDEDDLPPFDDWYLDIAQRASLSC